MSVSKAQRFAVLMMFALFAAPDALSAQVFDMGGLTATLSVDHVTQAERARAGARGEPRDRGPNSAAAAAMANALRSYGVDKAEPSAIPMAYSVDDRVERSTIDAYVDRVRQQDPSAAAVIAQQFRQHNPYRIYAAVVAPFGLRDNDVADSLAGYTILGWLIASGGPEPSPAAVRGFRNQLAARLSRDPQFADMTTRAQLGEELKLLFVTLHAGWQSARRDGSLQRYSDEVAALFLKQGTDLRSQRLTAQGFRN